MSEMLKGLFDEPEPERIIEPLEEWYPAWFSSGAPRTPSEAAAQAKRIAQDEGITVAEAAQKVAEQLRQFDQSAADNHL